MSIRCCAESTFTEPSTNISWIPDDGWYSNTLGCQNINKPVENYQGDKIRIFKGDLAKKWCYNLSTTKGHEYLIRGTFLFGDSVRTSLAILFNVSIGVTPIGLVNGSDDSVEVEGVFTARNHHIDFCLLKGTGDPYIYKLELRPLNVLKYLQGGTSSVLKLVKRVDVGNTGEDIRYVSLLRFNPRLLTAFKCLYFHGKVRKVVLSKLSLVRKTRRNRSKEKD